MKRFLLDDEDIRNALISCRVACDRAMVKHGPGAFLSRHEALGQVAEEYYELLLAIKSSDLGDKDRYAKDTVRAELVDIAVVCLWGIASIDSNAISED